MQEKEKSDSLSFPLSAEQEKEVRATAARIEALGKLLFFGFPRTSPGAMAAVHKADQYYRPQRYWRRG